MVDLSPGGPAGGAPEPVAYVRHLLTGLDVPWSLCGGWAADAWLGLPTRDHGDVDIAVFHHDQRAVFAYLPGWALVGHDPHVPDDTTGPWNGRHLDLPAHIHVPQRGSALSTSATATHAAFEFEFLLLDGSGGDWVLNPERSIMVRWERVVTRSAWGLPTLAPEVVLFYKAGGDLTAAEIDAHDGRFRPRDEQDFHALLPTLGEPRRRWLHDSLGRAWPRHPWLRHLGR